MQDEPRRHPIFLLCLVLTMLGSVPFLFVGSEQGHFWGVPYWLWSSAGFTVALAVVTAWGIVRYWKDSDCD